MRIVLGIKKVPCQEEHHNSTLHQPGNTHVGYVVKARARRGPPLRLLLAPEAVDIVPAPRHVRAVDNVGLRAADVDGVRAHKGGDGICRAGARRWVAMVGVTVWLAEGRGLRARDAGAKRARASERADAQPKSNMLLWNVWLSQNVSTVTTSGAHF